MKKKATDKKSPESIVYIVEDDDVIRLSLEALLDSINQANKSFVDGKSFLDYFNENKGSIKGCLILDVRLPGINGMEVQKQLNALNSSLPIIFVTGHGDIPMTVQALEHGAIGFLTKPYREQELLEKVNQALDVANSRYDELQEKLAFIEDLNTFTDRERTIFDMIMEGKASKVIAIELEISERTVEVHRSNLFKKLNTRSLTETIKKYIEYEIGKK